MWTILVITLIVVLLLGGERLASVGKGLGEGIKAFKKSVREPSQEPSKASEKPVIVVSAETLPPSPAHSGPSKPPSEKPEPKQGS